MNEFGYYESNLVRFRQGTPEKIGGWKRISAIVFLGICRSLLNWVTLASENLLGVGTNLKFYIENGGYYYDVTPISAEHTLTNPFTPDGTTTILVTDANGGFINNDFVTFYGGTPVGGQTITGEYQIAYLTDTTYNITIPFAATAGAPAGGTVYAVYQINTGSSLVLPLVGWGAGTWSSGSWGSSGTTDDPIRIWNQSNFGQDLIYGPGGGALYEWRANIGIVASNVTMTIASPSVVTTSLSLADKTAIQFETTIALPTGLLVGTTYYTKYVSATTFNLTTSTTLSATLTGVTITGIAGQFSCTASSVPLVIGQSLTLSGVYGGTGSIAGYADPTTYFIIATNGSTTFTLSTTAGGAGVVTTAGTPTGLTYTLSTVINTSGTQSGTQSISARGVLLSSLNGANAVPLYQNCLLVSDSSRQVLVFGTNEEGETVLDPMLIRWTDRETAVDWAASQTSYAGFTRLSIGSQIIAALQSRQEIVVWTDSALYSLQFKGPPNIWEPQLLADNISIAGPNAMAVASNVIYWMGIDKFYKYDGRVQTLRCDLRQFIYSDINSTQFKQIYSGTNEGFNEVWWFYCTADSYEINRYVVYNYTEDLWYYGSMGRTAWLDTGLRQFPVAATYSNNIVNHEDGVDDNISETAVAIDSSITTAQFDIDDGHNFAFVWRMLPDLTFRGSTDGTNPSLTIQLQPLQNSGSGYNDPISVGGTSATGTQTVNTAKNGVSPLYTYPQDPDIFTGQLNIRIRGRQMSFKIACNTLGTQWQLGAPRIDIRADGRRGS